MTEAAALEQIQSAILLPPSLAGKLDRLVQLGIGPNREALVSRALAEFIAENERRLQRKAHTLALKRQVEPGTPEWEVGFRELEEIASRSAHLSDEEMDAGTQIISLAQFARWVGAE
jgi:hypothetical protein